MGRTVNQKQADHCSSPAVEAASHWMNQSPLCSSLPLSKTKKLPWTPHRAPLGPEIQGIDGSNIVVDSGLLGYPGDNR